MFYASMIKEALYKNLVNYVVKKHGMVKKISYEIENAKKSVRRLLSLVKERKFSYLIFLLGEIR